MKLKILVGLLVVMSIYACTEDFDSFEENASPEFIEANFSAEFSDEKPDIHSKIILGEKLINPYSVENMQAAFNYYNANVPDSPFQRKKISATHYYIKILPVEEEHLVLIDSLDKSDQENAFVLHDFPLEYEILQEGDYYVEPTSENDLYHPTYTVIPVGYQMLGNLPYQIIEQLYYPEDEQEYDVETVALFFAGWKNDLDADEIEVTTETLPRYLNESRQQQTTQRLFGKRYTPKGRINVENTDANTPDPLKKAKVSIGRSFWWKYTYTDNSGNFTSSKKYWGKVRIRLKWRSYTATIRKTWNEVLGIAVSDHLITLKRSTNNRTKTIGYTEPNSGIVGIDLQGGHLWFKGTVHNGLRKYVDYCAQNGVNLSINDANVWAWT